MEPQKSLKEDWFLWLLLGSALVLVPVYYFLIPSDSSQDESPAWLFAGTQANSIKVLKKYRGNNLRLGIRRTKNAKGWTITRPAGVEVDSRAVSRWIETILDPEIKRRFKAKPGVKYGFGDTSVRLRVVQNGHSHDLYLGGSSPTGRGFYLRYGTAQKAPVFLLAESVKDSLNQSLHDIRDKDVFNRQNVTNMRGFSLSTKSETVTYRSETQGWKVVEPVDRNLNDTQTRDLKESLRTVLLVTAQTFYDNDVPKAFEPTNVKATFNFDNGSSQLKIGGKKKDERLIQRNDNPVVGLAQDPLVTLDKLPVKPSGWPEVKNKSSSFGQPTPPGGDEAERKKRGSLPLK